MKPKATIQWTLAFLLLASCMQAQSIWNTAHLANVKTLYSRAFLCHNLRDIESGSGQVIGRPAPFCHDERKNTCQR